MSTWIGWMVVGAAVAVPPGEVPVDHNQPYHSGPPVTRSFRRFPEDDYRQHQWEVYVRRLDCAWRDYRRAGSTREAFCVYKQTLADLKREYVYQDIYLESQAIPPRRPILAGEVVHDPHPPQSPTAEPVEPPAAEPHE